MMIAQRFPAYYDGILAVAPAVNIQKFIPAACWAQQVMGNHGVYPSPCKVDAFTAEAVSACDGLDGLVDGIVSSPSLCNFTAHIVVGKEFTCNGKTSRLSPAGATVVQAVWTGPSSPSGDISSPGLSLEASLTTTYILTTCSSNGTCSASNSDLVSSWIGTFVAKDRSFNLSGTTDEEFFDYLRLSQRDFASSFAADDDDFTAFRRAGGRLLSWQGLADETIPTKVNSEYYDKVLRVDPQVQDYYRFFEAPGVGHCEWGAGPLPNGTFDQLITWVENSTVPEILHAGSGNSSRPLCPYPSVQTFTGHTLSGGASFKCMPASVGL
ncbi:hypothetical protein B0A55_08104 [Friedmanniomyces simplex]|uniref:Carboxylic ester hydrolase n=1 Tax=Friedmanniomyces simplex TaxID=329884 RepID=A0A4V5NHC1_9PEZI|nr:hypothetical protein B0A55_08104 [Friedmanniomyces simplex]